VYEYFDHTADLGLRVLAPDPENLFRQAAEGLFSVIVEPVLPPACAEQLEFRVEGERLDYLLVDWLTELLYVFESRKLLLGSFEVRIDDRGLKAKALAQPLDVERHRLLHEVKAVTYHGLRVEETQTGWLAELILDI
jgi:SHS2 domain-containing protein